VAAGRASIRLEQSTNGVQEQLGQLEQAATLFGAVDRLLESMTGVLNGDERQLNVQNLAIVRSLLNEEAFARAWELGRAMSMEQAIVTALEEPQPRQQPR